MAKTMTSILIVAAVMPALTPSAAGAQQKAAGIQVDSARASFLSELRSRHLQFPVYGFSIERIRDSFRDRRSGKRRHNAIDIPAPRGTPVLSADSGRILRILRNELGGLMVYASDSHQRYIYSYAHLDRYRKGLREGAIVSRGDTIGYVGTTGNAPPKFPHLHFAILRAVDFQRWSRGTPVNPFEVFKSAGSNQLNASSN